MKMMRVFLFRAGTDLTTLDNNGRTPLQLAQVGVSLELNTQVDVSLNAQVDITLKAQVNISLNDQKNINLNAQINEISKAFLLLFKDMS